MRFFQFQSYFWKILSTIGVVSVGFLIIVMSTIAYYMVVPLGQRATYDLASIISHAADSWDNLSAVERSVFAKQMQRKHDLVLVSADVSLPDSTSLLPYLFFLETSLKKQTGKDIRLKTSIGKEKS